MSDTPFKDWVVNHIPESMMAAGLAAVGWWVQRKVARSDALEARVAALENDKVTKRDVTELREHIDATMARVESRTDEILLHLASRDR